MSMAVNTRPLPGRGNWIYGVFLAFTSFFKTAELSTKKARVVLYKLKRKYLNANQLKAKPMVNLPGATKFK